MSHDSALMTFHNYNKIQFNNILKVAQLIFGEAIHEWTFGGIEVTEETSLRYYPTIGIVTIGINKFVISSPQLYLSHLSHEICHLLHPSREYPGKFLNPTLVINEGISTWFQILVMQNNKSQAQLFTKELKEVKPNYYHAFLLIDELLKYNIESILLLRNVQPRIDRLVIDDFEKAGVQVPMELKRKLLETFNS